LFGFLFPGFENFIVLFIFAEMLLHFSIVNRGEMAVFVGRAGEFSAVFSLVGVPGDRLVRCRLWLF
jgi:hypothetical protein